jgi:CRP-like cAMP-binding protein
MVERKPSYLRRIALFKDLSDENFDQILQYLTQKTYAADKTIIEVGKEGDSLYIIEQGKVRVYITLPGKEEKIILSTLTRGDYFGEMALLTGEPRSANVETISRVELLRLDKAGFEKLLELNPAIVRSLSNMLSQRLKSANLMRAEAEKFYKSRIAPSGNLAEIPLIEMLKFCEHNSLSGLLRLQHRNQKAELNFLKGQIQTIQYKGLPESEAMDELMSWQEGQFIIEPEMYSLDEHAYSDRTESSDTYILENYFQDVLNRLVGIVGSQKLKEIVEDTWNRQRAFFPTLQSCTFKIGNKIKIDLSSITEYGDKEILSLAVFLKSIYEKCRTLVVGMSFLDLEEISDDKKGRLDELAFFEYMDQAQDLI